MVYRLVLTIALCAAAAYGAGNAWTAEPRDAHWLERHQHLLNQTHAHAAEVKVVFLGDSITQGWGGNGKHVWQQHYAPRHAFNYGIGGDRTEHILWRIANGEFENVKPKLVVLMIGELCSSLGNSIE